MKSMFFLVLLFVFVACAEMPEQALNIEKNKTSAKSPAEIYYIANEGVFVVADGKKILVDALFREGVEGYDVVPAGLRKKIEQAEQPFDKVDLVLASHYHADHFDPTSVATHLSNNPSALFVSTNQSIEKLKTVKELWGKIEKQARAIVPKEGVWESLTHNGIKLQVIYLHHGRSRPIENLGLIFHLDGKKFLHIGDTEANADDFKQYKLAEEKIDIAFVPYWFLFGENSRKTVRENINAKYLVPIHMPLNSDLDDGVKKMGGWDMFFQKVKTDFPNALVFRKPMDKHTLN